MVLFEVRNLSISFGDLKVVDSFQISIGKGQLYDLIEPNGAGRTTIFNLLTGVYKPDAGSTEPAGVNITDKETTEIDQVGIARTFQDICLFKDLFVLGSVKADPHNHYRCSTTAETLRLPNYFKVEKQVNERVIELLKILGLDEECGYKTSNLPYGKQRKLEIAKTLATEPELLLLDESVAEVNPNGAAELMDIIRFMRDSFDMTILLIGHGTELVSGICEEPTVLNLGQVLCQGEVGAVFHNPKAVKMYLGE